MPNEVDLPVNRGAAPECPLHRTGNELIEWLCSFPIFWEFSQLNGFRLSIEKHRN